MEQPTITDIEKRIISLISHGLSTKEMAVAMEYTEATVESYRLRLLRKFNVLNAPHLIAFAFRSGILPPHIDCPRCGGPTKIEIASTPINYKGKDHLVDHEHYKCQQCGMEFTTDIQDTDAWNQVMTKRKVAPDPLPPIQVRTGKK
jgi:YgiT-type zinc finger domain-containing protein